MKKTRIKKQVWQSLLSALVFGVFVYFALGSLGGSQQKKYLGNGKYEIAKFYGNGNSEIIQGPVDKHGNWHGATTFQFEDENGIMVSREEVNMTNGLRNGISTTTFASGRVYQVCYEMGERVDCEKSGEINSEEKSAFEIFRYKYPWMMTNLDAFGFSEEDVEAFIDTFETLLNANEFDLTDFDDYYDDIGDILAETPHDSVLEANAEISYFNGIELSQFNEFRYAVHDQFRSEGSTTFDIVKNTYSNYLLFLNEIEVSDDDFMRFCVVFDSIMYSYSPLNKEDPDLIDSLDNRMFTTINYLINDYEGSLVANESLKSLILSDVKIDIRKLGKISDQLLNKTKLSANPSEVSEAIVVLILLKYINGDKIRLALMESYAMQHGIVVLPAVTTRFQSRNSSSSVTLSGNIISDGGDEIALAGFYWGTGYNPDYTDFSVTADPGTGNFTATISALTEGVNYYARAFASNNAGIAFGNCIQFTTNGIVGIETNILIETDFTVFPNPASGVTNFRFNLESSKSIKLSIVNSNGQVCMERNLGLLPQGENRVEVDASALENGIYFGRLTDDNHFKIEQKFLVVH